MKLIVGLGNPGPQYGPNGHHVGYRCLNYFARLHSIRFERQWCQARIGVGKVASSDLLLAKPRTFVNFSGRAVGPLVSNYDISLNDLLVIYDDLDLPLGKIRLRPSGGSGGHNGMKSVISALESEEFPRIRVGIGHPVETEEAASADNDVIVNYVLGDFTPEEEKVLKPAIIKVAEAIDCFLTRGKETTLITVN